MSEWREGREGRWEWESGEGWREGVEGGREMVGL